MLSLFWNLSTAINGYTRFYMPTNRAVDWLRTPRGLKWAIPVALVATPAYLGAVSTCAHIATRPGLGWLNLLVLLFGWNAMKFALTAVFSPILFVASVWRELGSAASEDGAVATTSGPHHRAFDGGETSRLSASKQPCGRAIRPVSPTPPGQPRTAPNPR